MGTKISALESIRAWGDKPVPRWVVVLVALVALFALNVIGIVNTPESWRVLTGRPAEVNFEPQTPEERALMANLRPATTDEMWVLHDRLTKPYLQPLLNVMFVAVRDITLPPAAMSHGIVIALPKGVRWVAGPLTNQTLVFADPKFESPGLQPILGRPVHHPLCIPEELFMVDYISAWTCGEAFRQPATHQEMHANLRKLDPAEYARHPGLRYVPPGRTIMNVYVTTGDVYLSPDMGANDLAPPIILLAKTHRVLGGSIGASVVVSDFEQGGSRAPRHGVMFDPVYDWAWWRGRPDVVCRYLSPEVQRRYYPGAC